MISRGISFIFVFPPLSSHFIIFSLKEGGFFFCFFQTDLEQSGSEVRFLLVEGCLTFPLPPLSPEGYLHFPEFLGKSMWRLKSSFFLRASMLLFPPSRGCLLSSGGEQEGVGVHFLVFLFILTDSPHSARVHSESREAVSHRSLTPLFYLLRFFDSCRIVRMPEGPITSSQITPPDPFLLYRIVRPCV